MRRLGFIIVLFITVLLYYTPVSLWASMPQKSSLIDAVINVDALTKALEAKHQKGAAKGAVVSPNSPEIGVPFGLNILPRSQSVVVAPQPRVRNPFETPEKVRNRVFEIQQKLAMKKRKKKKKKKKKRVILSPLQTYDLKTLVVKGVVVGRGTHLAMVIAPDGESYTVKIGDIMGLDDLKVVDITSQGIVLKAANGTTSLLSLPKEEGE